MPQEELKKFLINLATNNGKIIKEHNKIEINYDQTLADYLSMDAITELHIVFDILYYSMYLEPNDKSDESDESNQDSTPNSDERYSSGSISYDEYEEDALVEMHEILLSIGSVISADKVVRSINLEGYNSADIVSDEVLKQISLALENNNSVEELHFLAKKNFGDSGIKSLSIMLEKNTVLKKLHLDSRFIDKGAIILARGLKNNKVLEELDISWRDVEVTEQYVNSFCSYLKKNTVLRKLVLTDFYLDNSLFFLVKSLNKLTNINHLEIKETDLDTKEFVDVLHLLRQHHAVGISNIKHLTVNAGDRIDKIKILNKLKQSEGLLSFELVLCKSTYSSFSQLDNKLLLLFANAINTNKSIKKLSLIVKDHNVYGADIHDGISKILKAVSSSSTLREFYFNGVDLKNAEWLKQRLEKFIKDFKDNNKALLHIEFPESWHNVIDKKTLNIVITRNIISLLAENWPKDLAINLLKYLKEMEHDFNVAIEDGWNLIHYAVYNDDIEAVHYLISEVNCNKEAKNDDHRTPLSIAAEFASKELVSLLITSGCDVLCGNAPNKIHSPELFEFAINYALYSKIDNKKIEILYSLTCGMLQYDTRKVFDKWLLSKVIEDNNFELFQIFLQNGMIFSLSDISLDIIPENIKDLIEIISIIQSEEATFTNEKKYEEIKQRIEKGASLNIIDNGNSLMRLALVSKQIELSAYLMVKGAYYDQGIFDSFLDRNEQYEVGRYGMQYLVHSKDKVVMYLISRSLTTKVPEGELALDLKQIYSDLYGLNSDYNSIPSTYFKPIMDVLYHSGITVVFDYSCEHTQRVAVNTGVSTRGLCDPNTNIIYIGAKIGPKRLYNDLLGTIIHEFTHQACQFIWKNNCQPFSVDDVEQKVQIKILLNNIETNRNNHDVIERVFSCYQEEKEEKKDATRAAEIIVRIPQLFALYYFDEKYEYSAIEAEITKPWIKELHDYFKGFFLQGVTKHILEKELSGPFEPSKIFQHCLSMMYVNQVIQITDVVLENEIIQDSNKEILAAIIIQKQYRSKMSKELKINIKNIVKEEIDLLGFIDSKKFVYAYKGVWQDIHKKLMPIYNEHSLYAQLFKSRELVQLATTEYSLSFANANKKEGGLLCIDASMDHEYVMLNEKAFQNFGGALVATSKEFSKSYTKLLAIEDTKTTSRGIDLFLLGLSAQQVIRFEPTIRYFFQIMNIKIPKFGVSNEAKAGLDFVFGIIKINFDNSLILGQTFESSSYYATMEIYEYMHNNTVEQPKDLISLTKACSTDIIFGGLLGLSSASPVYGMISGSSICLNKYQLFKDESSAQTVFRYGADFTSGAFLTNYRQHN